MMKTCILMILIITLSIALVGVILYKHEEQFTYFCPFCQHPMDRVKFHISGPDFQREELVIRCSKKDCEFEIMDDAFQGWYDKVK